MNYFKIFMYILRICIPLLTLGKKIRARLDTNWRLASNDNGIIYTNYDSTDNQQGFIPPTKLLAEDLDDDIARRFEKSRKKEFLALVFSESSLSFLLIFNHISDHEFIDLIFCYLNVILSTVLFVLWNMNQDQQYQQFNVISRSISVSDEMEIVNSNGESNIIPIEQMRSRRDENEPRKLSFHSLPILTTLLALSPINTASAAPIPGKLALQDSTGNSVGVVFSICFAFLLLSKIYDTKMPALNRWLEILQCFLVMVYLKFKIGRRLFFACNSVNFNYFQVTTVILIHLAHMIMSREKRDDIVYHIVDTPDLSFVQESPLGSPYRRQHVEPVKRITPVSVIEILDGVGYD